MTDTNYGIIPGAWHLNRDPAHMIVDTSVEHTPGNPSIRLDPTTAALNPNRECDGQWLPCKPGDHITISIWILMDNVTTNTDPYLGGRLGFDFIAPMGDGTITIVDGFPHGGAEHLASVVRWGTAGWVQKSWDYIVPDTVFTKDVYGNTIPASPITMFVFWIDLKPIDTGKAWFADAEVYINPTGAPPGECPVGYHLDPGSGLCVPDIIPPASYSLTMTSQVGGSTDPGTGRYTHQVGTQITITASPVPGYAWRYWNFTEPGIAAATITNNPYTFTMPSGDVSAEAVFQAIATPPSSGYCFIVTACGVHNACLSTFYHVRDRCFPIALVRFYYRVSPRIANYIRKKHTIRQILKSFFEWFASKLHPPV
jgi:hypothetical protein